MDILDNKITRFFLRKRGAYRRVFSSNPDTDVVLNDLRKFCRGMTTPAMVSPLTQTVDPIATGIAIGRLEVWQRIVQNINISDADLYKFMEQQDNGTE